MVKDTVLYITLAVTSCLNWLRVGSNSGDANTSPNPALFRPKHACLMVSSTFLCLGMGSLTVMGREKQPKSKNTVLLRIVRRQILSCLSHAIIIPLGREATERKFTWGTPSDCLSFPCCFLLYVVSTQFDNVMSLAIYLFFYVEASPWVTPSYPGFPAKDPSWLP